MSRFPDEAEHYVVRDRGTCEKSFRRWLKQKNSEQQMKQQQRAGYGGGRRLQQRTTATTRISATTRTSATTRISPSLSARPKPPKDNNNNNNNRRKVQSAMPDLQSKRIVKSAGSLKTAFSQISSAQMSRIRQMSKVRYCETFGYQHPASYDDILIK